MHPEQPGIFRDGFRHFHVLEYRLAEDTTRGGLLTALRAALTPDSATLATVVAFGPGVTPRLDDHAPSFDAFREIAGRDGFVMPATQHDVLFWLQGTDNDVLFDAVHRIDSALAAHGRAEIDLPCFTYHDSRDLTGFIDGSANPTGKAARNAALIPEGQPGEGGSYVFTQRWLHDLAAFQALPVAEQEMIVGRTRADSVELDAAHMPRTAHVARTDLKVDGEAMKIWRRSMPFGTAREHGLQFLAFACRLGRFDALLRSMAGADAEAVRDRLTDFSRPVSGSYWYAPPAAQLARWLR